MTKLSLALLAISLLTSCNLFKSSDLYVAVAKTQAREATSNSEALESVRTLLVKRGIEYKMVKFRYDVAPRTGIELARLADFSGETPLVSRKKRRVVRERMGIIYRDEANPGEPWWYVDGEVRRPIWLPSTRVAMQVSFAMRRKIELLQLQESQGFTVGLTKDPTFTPPLPEDFWNERFRRANGTAFDPSSPVDIAKMRHLKMR